jgi:hypothetical protein
MKSQQR